MPPDPSRWGRGLLTAGGLLTALSFLASGCGTEDPDLISLDVSVRDGGGVDAREGIDAGSFDAFVGRDAFGRDDIKIWASSSNTLYELSPISREVREVGGFTDAFDQRVTGMLDLAVNGNGELFGVARERLWRIDSSTAKCVAIAAFDLGFTPNSLTFLPSGVLGPEEVLVAGGGSTIARIDLDTGDSEVVASLPGFTTSGDFVSNRDWGSRILATVNGETPGTDLLVWVDISTGSVTPVGSDGGNIGFDNIFGLGYWDGLLYGFTSRGELIGIGEEDGVGFLIEASTGASQFFGAGVTTIFFF